jgi:RNA polymerase sigma-70 factor (ECF subfamily)
VDRTATFEAERERLFAIAYRMLGTASDAADVVQEAYIRWQNAKSGEIDSPRAFLSTVVTRLAIDQLKSARVQREQYVGPWLPEPLVEDTARSPADQLLLAESLSMAFLLVLDQLGPVERAVYILREVFDYDYDDVARIVGKTSEHCRQLLHRAKARVVAAREKATPTPQAEQERLMQQFLATLATGDVERLASMLADDVVAWSDGGGKRSAARKPIRGPMRVARFFASVWRKAAGLAAVHLVRVNGTPGLVVYVGSRPYTVVAFDIAGDRITAVRTVVNPEKLRHLPSLQ